MAKVFVVEDDERLRRVIVMTLKLGGHEVILQAGSIERALEKLGDVDQLGVSVAVLDGAFPYEGDGVSLATALRKRVPSIKIISLAGHMQSWGGIGTLRSPKASRLSVLPLRRCLTYK